tara:strand:- start:202 stop:639 length:438 start_codon:yes stop_codon:yes gene_type:complete
LTITDKKMTRFNITLPESTSLVMWALENAYGSEILVPKIPSYRILDLAKSICKKCKIKITGARPGEKINEEMISFEESRNVIELKKYFVVLQNGNYNQKKFYMKKLNGKVIKKQFSYSSDKNFVFLSNQQLKKLINKNLFKDKKD